MEDFVACFEDASGKDLKQFMTWYSQAGTPELVCQLKYDARAKTAELPISQVLPPTPGEAKKKPLHIPVRLGLLGGNGQDLDLTLASGERLEDGLVELTKRTETVPLPRRAVAAGAVAAARLLGAREPDHRPAGRGPAVPDGQRQRPLQSLAGGAGLRHARAARGGRRRCAPASRPPQPTAFIEALAVTLGDDSLEPGYRAQFLYPAERERPGARHRPRRRPAGHPQGAQGACARRSARGCTTRFADIYREHGGQGALLAGARSRPAGGRCATWRSAT